MKTLNTQTGLNMVEIMAILVVLAMLGAMAVPRGNQQQVEKPQSGPEHSVDAVKTAHATAIVDLKRFPTVNELSGYVENLKSRASSNAIQVSIAGKQYSVATYSDSNCNTQTKTIADNVACIGRLQ